MIDARPHPGVWLFTRQFESVRMHVQPGPAGLQLVIFGPGNASAEFDFTDRENLDRFRVKYENDLLARGFVLGASAERRSGSERRAALRAVPVDRRR